MTPSNAELAEEVKRLDRRTNKLTETLGYMQDDLHTLTVEQKTQAKRLDRVEVRLDGIDGRLDGIDGRLDGIDGRLDGIDGRLDGVHGRLDGIDGRLDGVHGRLDKHGDLLREILRRLPEH